MAFGERTAGIALALALALTPALSACKSTPKGKKPITSASDNNPGPCPRAFALYDAARIVEFRGPQSFASVGFSGEIKSVRSLCRYYGVQPIDADLDIQFELGRGPAAAAQSAATYEYFVAVTRKNVDVIEKQVFPLQVTFPAGADRITVNEKIDRVLIPRASESTSGENFEIIVGFVVTPEQRAFNAEGKRFRMSVGQK